MKQVLIFLLLCLSLQISAQITLEQVYDSAATYNWCAGPASQLMMVDFEVSGERYVRINRCGKNLNLYDLNHNLLKSISLAGIPQTYNNQVGQILYISEQLFDLDSKMEFMYIHEFNDPGTGNGSFATSIYNEDLDLLFRDTSAAWISLNFHMQQYPIYNTADGTKMILSCPNVGAARNNARVFSLPGTFTTAIAHANAQLMEMNTLSPPHPNPSGEYTRIDFVMPSGVERGDVVFYDLNGKEIRRMGVSGATGVLQVSTADIAAGTYYYRLVTAGDLSGTKRMVVVR